MIRRSILLRSSILIFLVFFGSGTSFSMNNLAPQHTAVPSPLTPPPEDVAQLEEVLDEPSEAGLYHIPMVLNDSVENQIEFYKSRGRDVFQAWLDRSARFMPLMKEIFREKNLPDDLVYVAMIESGFNPSAVSWARAVGPWQFMPATGKIYGLKIDWWIDERKDPVKSTYAAAAHLKDLYNLFNSWSLALASYNAGAGKVQRAVLRTRSDDFWDLKDSKFIRRETKNYVPKYMAAMMIAKNPEDYGFTTPPLNPFVYDEVVVEESVDLRMAAKCSGSTYQEIKELNPELKRWVTPPHAVKYTLRIPRGRKEVFLINYAAIPAEQRIIWERHEIRKGDTLPSLAKQYNTTVAAIRDVNDLVKNRLVPGKHILVPVNIASRDNSLAYLAQAPSSNQQQILYRVRRGETLSKIARMHNITVADIREWNRGLGNSVRTGQKIRLVVDIDRI